MLTSSCRAARWSLVALLLSTTGCDGDGPSEADRSAYRGFFVRQSACFDQPLGGFQASNARDVETVFPGFLSEPNTATLCGDAGSCDAFRACLGIDPARTCDASFDSHCADATHLEQCRDGLVRVTDCAQRGHGNTRCVQTERGAHCGDGTCPAPEPTVGFCEGDVEIECEAGVRVRYDCSVLGRTCAATDGRSRCVDAAEDCSAGRCEGAVAVGCSPGIGVTRRDCEVYLGPGATCVLEDSTPRCVPASPECEDDDVRCDGDTALVCLAQTWEAFDCAEFGGRTCRLVDGGVLTCADR